MVNDKVVKQPICKHCKIAFDITEEDRAFYDKIAPTFAGKKYSIPDPTLCPDCRQQRRLVRRNERKLYHNKSSLAGKEIVSIYSPDKPYQVYTSEERRSDQRDPLEYGMVFDFNTSFFQQFDKLLKAVPHNALRIANSENSEYTNMSGYNKNCYLLFASEYSENSAYGTNLIRSKYTYDAFKCCDVEHCYEVVNCDRCYQVFFARNSKDCTNCMYVEDCIGCSDCLFSSHLVNAQYHIFNEQYNREEYLVLKKKLLSDLQNQVVIFKVMCQKGVQKNLSNVNVENSMGEYLFQTKNAYYCFDLSYGEDCRYTYMGFETKDLMDVSGTSKGILGYEATSIGYDSYHGIGVCGMWTCSECMYSFDIHHSSNLFGCVGLRNKQYCIFNRQYTREEYEILVPQIIEKMIADGEWGEFFPSHLSPFGYNETVAMEYYPLTKDEAVTKGFERSDYEVPFPQVTKTLSVNELPDIHDVTDDILNHAIICEISAKPFRIIKQELEFYRKHSLPIPKCHPDQRHSQRMALRNPHKLRKRNCMKCEKEIMTSYSPQSTVIVCCEDCYNKEIY